MVAPYWGMPCGRESRADCNIVWLADDIKTKIIKCSSRSVLANPGYGTILYNKYHIQAMQSSNKPK